jgi:hypothetical protein
MDIFIWHRIFPDYEERLERMGNPASVSMAKREANQLTLVPME